ncbi:MAG TPA: PepSY domain-containing protein [Rummeliibacillus sp.]|nr:PepSY domain-containing protein [Rummeliibacillus sp.]
MKKTMIAFAITGCLAVSGVVAVAAQNTGKHNILSSEEISKKALSYVKGQVYKVELDHEKRGPVYDVDVKNKQAKYELKLDAKTGELLEKSTKYTSDFALDHKMIGLERAKKIALKVVNGKIQNAKLNEDNDIYEIEILKGKFEYDIDINAYTGKIVKKNKEKMTTSNRKAISLNKAKQIALNYINGVVQKAKYDSHRGIYEIHVAKNSTTYKFNIDAYTGEILKGESKGATNTVSSYGIGVEKAKQIALNAVGGTVIEATLDNDDGVYEVKVQNGDFVYQVEINAITGVIVKQEKGDSSQSLNNNGTTVIGIEKAKQIALSKVSGTVTSTNYDQDNGVYEISISANGYEYDFDINAQTGDIIKQDQKSVESASANNDSAIITSQQASQIALTKAKGTVTKIDLENGVYDVEILDGTYQYAIKIDAQTGDVLSVNKDYED